MSAPQQLQLLARKRDPDTAQRAARAVRANSLEAVVLHALRIALTGSAYGETPGYTTEELAQHLGMSVVTVSPRMRPLERKGLVRDSGSRRKNDSGHPAIVWVAV